jgi:CDP-diglyceride synthetase
MARGDNNRSYGWRGALGGMLAGVVLTVLIYVYHQVTNPMDLNGIDLYLVVVFVPVGAMLGMVVSAWLASD